MITQTTRGRVKPALALMIIALSVLFLYAMDALRRGKDQNPPTEARAQRAAFGRTGAQYCITFLTYLSRG